MDSRLLGIAAAASGAVLLVVGALQSSWLKGRDYGIVTNVGLLDMEICTPEPGSADDLSCEVVSLSDAAESPSAPEGLGAYRIAALATLGLGLVTALALFVTAGFAAARRFVQHGMPPSSAALVGAVFTVISSVVTLSMNPYQSVGWGTGTGFIIFGAGATLGLLGAIFCGRLRPPPSESDLFNPPFDPV